MSEEHYLDSYLAEILPALGLDVETYAPYVTTADTDEDSDFDEIIELLKASCESDGEDDDAWDNFKKEILRRREEYISGETVRKELQAMQVQAATQANLQKEIEVSQQNAINMEERKQKELEKSKLENMSKEKLALMSAYGYEDGGGDDTTAGHTDEDDNRPMTNRDHAAQVSKQNAEKHRSTHTTQSKQEARQETAKAKAAKETKKEERRKKAGKKERQR